MCHNGTKETATIATEEEQNRRELFAVAIYFTEQRNHFVVVAVATALLRRLSGDDA